MFVSAEIRWFWQDDCPANLRRWFDETPHVASGGELRIDQYLLLTDESEISIKRRGENPDVEIKGLAATLRNERGFLLEITDKVIVRKVRWLRTYDGPVPPSAKFRCRSTTHDRIKLGGKVNGL
jgi:hypothetical protein